MASLRANSSVPHSVILEVAKTCNSIEKIATDRALNIVYDHMCEIENGEAIYAQIRNEVEAALTPTTIPHTTYEIGKHFENHDFFVKPKTVLLGNRFEHRVNNGRSENILVQDTFEYVSVKQMLQVLCKNSDYVSQLRSNRGSNTIYSCFQDRKLYKSNEFIKNKDGIVICLQLFYDGMGTTNALK